VVGKVVPDAVYAGMWRIDLGDGALSDMVNLTRAKEAAAMRADANATQAPRPCVKTVAPLNPTAGAGGNALVAFLRGLRHRHRDPWQRGIKLLCRNPSTG
jgi:hypothetical protein